MRTIAKGLRFPEGPVWMVDGSVALVEIERKTVSIVAPDGSVRVLATPGGGPNGLGVGPDGAFYVCNNGGLVFHQTAEGMRPGLEPEDYTGGRIERIDPRTGDVTVLYDACGAHKLRGPNDIVFDSEGGFYFTDLGKTHARARDLGGVYYAKADGSLITEVAYPVMTPNGIGLSPDESTIYVAETVTSRVWAFDLEAPGIARKYRAPAAHGGRLVAGLPGYQLFDSLAVDADGNVCVATLVTGAITVIAPDGRVVRTVELPDPFTTNICFGGVGLRTAYITLSGIGELIALDWTGPDWSVAGLPLAYQT